MKVTVLGFWGGYPFKNEGTSAYLVESEGYHLLVDAGSASLIALEQHIDPLELDAVILSHYHHDHIADIGVLQFLRQLKRKNHGEDRAPILPIYAHTENAQGFSALTLERVSEGIAYEEHHKTYVGPFEITFMRTLHPVPCFAMRIEEVKTGKVLVYTADSGYLADFIPFSKGADVLLADTNFFEGMENHRVHMTSVEVARIAKEAKVSKLVLTHLPQTGDLELLKAEAINHVENTEVLLAKKDLIIEL
ncbi:MBL fold metallo-hydrolase [Carnobacterium divergens]|uniref:Metal-dependent hydrolase n=1 Tax=Carnobacterium divergens DSM 20623 TaxID=1449336 RepID=A0A0R2HUK0_CARDV|nr:MBL fold metallo-hydrolase [Carnobacterium divergens]KRN56353.1 metal-dependent hydrolase [Carnobacterium divergens DSM 20623]MDO0875055.1 MBL fold metallo-hydrolase [Carnobacterium divergens]SUX18119.1 ribonuclease Z [Carnobacterium divergens]